MRALSLTLCCAIAISLGAQDTYHLEADGVTDTYTLIENAGFYAETQDNRTPDDFMCHPQYNHISQLFHPDLGQYVFAFDIHIDFSQDGKPVTDGNKNELVDRQRNEIKCMDNVAGTVASAGQTITYRWKFCLPQGMKTTSEFCHIHQIKGMGSGPEVAHPVITFTCRTQGAGQLLQVINVPYEGAPNTYLAQTDLKPLLGKWLQATETFTVGLNGKYSLTITDIQSGQTVVSIDEADIPIWRDTNDNSTMRGKWGIYRSLGTNLNLKSQLRSERLFFADIEAAKATDALTRIEAPDGSANTLIYNLNGIPVENPRNGIYIINGKKTLIKNQ